MAISPVAQGGGLPVSTPSSSPQPVTPPQRNVCYNVYPPVISVYATPQPVIYTVFAFLFDPLTAPVKVPPIPAVKSRKKTPPAEVSAFSSVNALGTLYSTMLRKELRYPYIAYKVIDTVIQPLCTTSYVVLRVKPRSAVRGTGTRSPISVATYEPVAIGGVLNAVSLFTSQSALTTMANVYYTMTTAPVQFIPDVTAYQSLLDALANKLGVK